MTDIKILPSGVGVQTEDGSRYTADIVVGADGYEGKTREFVTGEVSQGVPDRRLTLKWALLFIKSISSLTRNIASQSQQR